MLDRDVLSIEPELMTGRLVRFIHDGVLGRLRRRGVVVGISGGVDSAVVAALCARALGPERVLGLLMPERDSSPDSLRLGELVAGRLGIRCEVEDITATLEAAGAYARQTAAIQRVFPDHEQGSRFKLVLPSILDSARLGVFVLTVEDQLGNQRSSRMPPRAYLELVAATNFKQRVRKLVEYHHADRLQFAVAGTPNRLEFDQGFFVKQGDGAADIKPIAQLYKTQVYALAEHLGIPEEIRARPPTTDTFSMPQTQEEFYFSLRYDAMDLCLYAVDHGIGASEVAPALGLTIEQCQRVYRDVADKRRATRYQHAAALIPPDFETPSARA